MRVLVTRALADAVPLARRLAAAGVEALIEPLLEIHFHAAGAELDGVQAVLVTSANGARALAAAGARRDLAVYAVGDASAQAAAEAGFHPVHSAAGTVEDLAARVVAELDARAGRLVHVAGTHVAGDLAGHLTAAGFSVERAVLYEARPARALGDVATQALRAGSLDAVLFFSPRTAAAFVSLVAAAGLAEHCRRLDALCLSRSIAEALADVEWRKVAIAARPEQQALLALCGINDRGGP